MHDAMEDIQKLATERQQLYRLAAKQHFTPEQLDRLHEIDGRLPGLWDLHRRELLAQRRPQKETSYAFWQAA